METDFEIYTFLEVELERLLEWVRAAESRLSLILPLSMGMLGVISILASVEDEWTVFMKVNAFLAVSLLSLSIVFAALATFPRTKGPKDSVIYFGGITNMQLSEYKNTVKELSFEELVNDLIGQCYRNAQIAKEKYFWIQRSIGCIFLASIPWTVSLIIFYNG